MDVVKMFITHAHEGCLRYAPSDRHVVSMRLWTTDAVGATVWNQIAGSGGADWRIAGRLKEWLVDGFGGVARCGADPQNDRFQRYGIWVGGLLSRVLCVRNLRIHSGTCRY
jgi:hypothetical protein